MSTRKTIVRLSSNQVLKQISNSQIANKQQQTVEPQTLTRLNSALCGPEKPCGLFNPFAFDFEDIENNNGSILHNDEHLLMDLLNIPELDCEAPQIPVFEQIFENTENNQVVTTDAIGNNGVEEQQQPKRIISKFSKKVQELNLKINIPSRQTLSSFGLATPTEKESPLSTQIKEQIAMDHDQMYQTFIDTQPLINFDLLDKFGTEENFEKLILGFPTSQGTKITECDPFLKADSEAVKFQMDHEYSAKKRKSSEDSVFDDSFSMDSFASSFSSLKRQRVRGIYRAEDVTNDEERQNYLERRIKNNMSSKISRANKKNVYNQMDDRCLQLENSNQELRVKMEELESLNQIIKDLLVEKFTQCK